MPGVVERSEAEVAAREALAAEQPPKPPPEKWINYVSPQDGQSQKVTEGSDLEEEISTNPLWQDAETYEIPVTAPGPPSEEAPAEEEGA